MLGADKNGRDVLSRLIFGTRTALGGALAVVLISELIGVPLGIWAAYRGGWVDETVTRVWDMLLSFPPLLLAFAVVAAFGPGLPKAALALGILYVPFISRVVRSVTLVQKEMVYTEAARAIGYGQGRIIFRHILPNCISPVIVVSTIDTAYAMLDLAALSFLGLGVQPPTADWGTMLSEGQLVLLTSPHLAVASGLAIVLAVLGFQSARRRSARRARPTAGPTMTPLLQIDDLRIWFGTRTGDVRAVDGVDLEIAPGEMLGLVGESGSGKSVTARAIMRLVPMPPGKHVSGHIMFEGVDLTAVPEREMQDIRGSHIAMIFQDPMTFLNPLYTAGEQVAEAIRRHQKLDRAAAQG